MGSPATSSSYCSCFSCCVAAGGVAVALLRSATQEQQEASTPQEPA